MKLTIFFLFFILSLSTYGNNSSFCDDKLGPFPILANGRVKPLYVHAGEMIKHLTGKSKVENFKALTAYCMLSLRSMGVENKDLVFKTKIEHPKLRKFLGLESSPYIKLDDLADRKQDIRFEMVKVEKGSSYEKSIKKLMNKVGLYEYIASGKDWQAPIITDGKTNWLPINQFLSMDNLKPLAQGANNPIPILFDKASKGYKAANPNGTYSLEYKYAKIKLPRWGLLFSLLTLALLVLIKKSDKVPVIFAGITLLIQTVYMILRIYISGRAPITNMYETVLFSGFGALLLAMIIGHYKKDRTFLYVGLSYNAMTLMMLNFSGGLLSASIGPLVPVLRDNFWLSTHVTTIILSYGALALSWVLANMILIKNKFSTLSSKDLKVHSDYIYICLKWGTVMLAAGIILGGVWADYSWGRFWGWDPKETWSLIVFCLYMAILHGRYTNWINNRRFAPLVALAFLSVMMAWFGVNYILATGLHSYGFSEGGAIFLGSFALIQIIILSITYPKFAKAKG